MGGGNPPPPPGAPMGQSRQRSAASLRHQIFDSNGPDVRVRGNAWQVYEKYQALARDATSAGDRVAAENYLQHAEHYYRIIEAINEATAQETRLRGGPSSQPASPSPVPFGQQPETPANYYTQEPPPAGNPPPSRAGLAPTPSAPSPAAPSAGEGEAQVTRSSAATSSFFTSFEAEEPSDGPTPLVVNR